MPQAASQKPVVIWVARESDGVSFALDRESRVRLGAAGSKAWSRVFVGWDTKEDYESIHGDITNQVVTLLTGTTIAKLKPLGGVLFKDRSVGRQKILPKPASAFLWPVKTSVKGAAKRSPSSSKTA
jgi:hypothetical protein